MTFFKSWIYNALQKSSYKNVNLMPTSLKLKGSKDSPCQVCLALRINYVRIHLMYHFNFILSICLGAFLWKYNPLKVVNSTDMYSIDNWIWTSLLLCAALLSQNAVSSAFQISCTILSFTAIYFWEISRRSMFFKN